MRVYLLGESTPLRERDKRMCAYFLVDFAGYLRACVTLLCMCGTRFRVVCACGLFIYGGEISGLLPISGLLIIAYLSGLLEFGKKRAQ